MINLFLRQGTISIQGAWIDKDTHTGSYLSCITHYKHTKQRTRPPMLWFLSSSPAAPLTIQPSVHPHIFSVFPSYRWGGVWELTLGRGKHLLSLTFVPTPPLSALPTYLLPLSRFTLVLSALSLSRLSFFCQSTLLPAATNKSINYLD